MVRGGRPGPGPLARATVVVLIGLTGCSGSAPIRAEAGPAGGADAHPVPVARLAPTTPPPTTTTTVPAPDPLGEGAVGPRVEAVEAALAVMRFQPGAVDGTFDAATTGAVWAFQALHGHPRTGVVDAGLEAEILALPRLEMLRPDLGPTHVEVDLTRQVLLVWTDGALRMVSHVSTGSEVPYCENGSCGDAVTPEGTFRFEYRIVGERHAPLGVLHDPVYFTHRGHAVHGDPDVPDHPASHGCVRIPMHVSPVFPTLVADGDPVVVFRS